MWSAIVILMIGTIICNFRYCPGCKTHRQASKKLDLWRLPEILVIHLKRFSYSRFMKNKLETYVDFPVDNLDLSTYITHKNGMVSNRYMLYAVSNHYGSMGGGHYTAFVHVSDAYCLIVFFFHFMEHFYFYYCRFQNENKLILKKI